MQAADMPVIEAVLAADEDFPKRPFAGHGHFSRLAFLTGHGPEIAYC
jgi:hypothetical protein